MATSQTIIIILEELGDEDFKSFKWHLSEEKRIPRQIPYAQLAKLDRVDTSAKIKQSYGTERGLRFMMLILEVIDRNDLKESARGSQYKMYGFMAVGLLCAIVGNILMVVATATDYWHGWPRDGNPQLYIKGLWKLCVDHTCRPHMGDEWAFFVLLTMAVYTGMTFAAFQSNTDWFFGWSYRLGWGATGMVLFAGIFYMCAYRYRGTGPR